MPRLTVNFNHEGLNDIVSNHLKVGVTNPVGDGSSATGEEVVKDCNFMTEEHKTVDQVGSDETGTTSDYTLSACVSCSSWRKANPEADSLRILFLSALGRSLTAGNLAMVV